MQTTPRPIQVAKTLDVDAVERELAVLWKESARDAQSDDEPQSDDEEALLRSRVANLMVFLANESEIAEAQETIGELSVIHPCRALMVVGERDAEDRDIELYVSAVCQSGKPSPARHLCCEEVTLIARGHFASELPSAAIPLLVPDLPVFLWWRDVLRFDKIFSRLSQAADRLILDSADFQNPLSDLSSLAQFFNRDEHEAVAISDVNWARLTSWRSLLASFYDVQKYRIELDRINDVQIDFVAPGSRPEALAPQALLIAGWLASRLGWSVTYEQPPQETAETVSFKFRKSDQVIKLEFHRLHRPEMRPGRLAQVALFRQGNSDQASFVVSRSADGLRLKTETKIGSAVHPGRVLQVRNRSTAQLLSREMEILCNDSVYEEAIRSAATMIGAQTQPPNS